MTHPDIVDAMRKCPDVLDYPTAWAIQKHAAIPHGAMCSSVPGWHPLSGAGLLCDCGSVQSEWERLKKEAEE